MIDGPTGEALTPEQPRLRGGESASRLSRSSDAVFDGQNLRLGFLDKKPDGTDNSEAEKLQQAQKLAERLNKPATEVVRVDGEFVVKTPFGEVKLGSSPMEAITRLRGELPGNLGSFKDNITRQIQQVDEGKKPTTSTLLGREVKAEEIVSLQKKVEQALQNPDSKLAGVYFNSFGNEKFADFNSLATILVADFLAQNPTANSQQIMTEALSRISRLAEAQSIVGGDVVVPNTALAIVGKDGSLTTFVSGEGMIAIARRDVATLEEEKTAGRFGPLNLIEEQVAIKYPVAYQKLKDGDKIVLCNKSDKVNIPTEPDKSVSEIVEKLNQTSEAIALTDKAPEIPVTEVAVDEEKPAVVVAPVAGDEAVVPEVASVAMLNEGPVAKLAQRLRGAGAAVGGALGGAGEAGRHGAVTVLGRLRNLGKVLDGVGGLSSDEIDRINNPKTAKEKINAASDLPEGQPYEKEPEIKNIINKVQDALNGNNTELQTTVLNEVAGVLGANLEAVEGETLSDRMFTERTRLAFVETLITGQRSQTTPEAVAANIRLLIGNDELLKAFGTLLSRDTTALSENGGLTSPKGYAEQTREAATRLLLESARRAVKSGDEALLNLFKDRVLKDHSEVAVALRHQAELRRSPGDGGLPAYEDVRMPRSSYFSYEQQSAVNALQFFEVLKIDDLTTVTPVVPENTNEGDDKTVVATVGESDVDDKDKTNEEAQQKIKLDQEQKLKAEADVKIKAEAEKKLKRDEEVKLKAQTEEKLKKEAEEKRKVETETKKKAETEVKEKTDIAEAASERTFPYYEDEEAGYALDEIRPHLKLVMTTKDASGKEVKTEVDYWERTDKLVEQSKALLPKKADESDFDYKTRLLDELEKRVRFPGDFKTKGDDKIFDATQREPEQDVLLMAIEAQRASLAREDNIKIAKGHNAAEAEDLRRREVRTKVDHQSIVAQITGEFDEYFTAGKSTLIDKKTGKPIETHIQKEMPQEDLVAFAFVADVLMDTPDPSLGRGADGKPLTYRQAFVKLEGSELREQRLKFYDMTRQALEERQLSAGKEPVTENEKILREMKIRLHTLQLEIQSGATVDDLLNKYKGATLEDDKKKVSERSKTKIKDMLNKAKGNMFDLALKGSDLMRRRAKLEGPERHKVPKVIKRKSLVEWPTGKKTTTTGGRTTSTRKDKDEDKDKDKDKKDKDKDVRRDDGGSDDEDDKNNPLPAPGQTRKPGTVPESKAPSELSPAPGQEGKEGEGDGEEFKPGPPKKKGKEDEDQGGSDDGDKKREQEEPLPLQETAAAVGLQNRAAVNTVEIGAHSFSHEIDREPIPGYARIPLLGGVLYGVRHPIRNIWQHGIFKTVFKQQHVRFAAGVENDVKNAFVNRNIPVEVSNSLVDSITEQGRLRRGNSNIFSRTGWWFWDKFTGITGTFQKSEQILGRRWLRQTLATQPRDQWNTLLGIDSTNVLTQQAKVAQKFADLAGLGGANAASRFLSRGEVYNELVSDTANRQLKSIIERYATGAIGSQEQFIAEVNAYYLSDAFRNLLPAASRSQFRATEAATNLGEIAERVKAKWNKYQEKDESGKTNWEKYQLKIVYGNAEWGGERGGSMDRLVEMTARRMVNREGAVGTGLFAGVGALVGDILTYGGGYAAGWFAGGAALGTSTFARSAGGVVGAAIVSGLKETGFRVGRFGWTGRTAREAAQMSREIAKNRIDHPGSVIRPELRAALVDTTGWRASEIQTRLTGLVDQNKVLTDVEARSLMMQLAELDARMRLSDLSNTGALHYQTQNYITYTEGKSSEEYQQLKSLLLNGIVKLQTTNLATGALFYSPNGIQYNAPNANLGIFDRYSAVAEGQLRFGSNDQVVRRWMQRDLRLNQADVNSIMTDIYQNNNINVAADNTLEARRATLRNLSRQRGARAAAYTLLGGALSPLITVPARELYQEAAWGLSHGWTESINTWRGILDRGHVPIRPDASGNLFADVSPLQRGVLLAKPFFEAPHWPPANIPLHHENIDGVDINLSPAIRVEQTANGGTVMFDVLNNKVADLRGFHFDAIDNAGAHNLVLVDVNGHSIGINDPGSPLRGFGVSEGIPMISPAGEIKPGTIVDKAVGGGGEVRGPEAIAEWGKHSAKFDRTEYYSYNLPGSQGNELRLNDFKSGNEVTLSMKSMGVGVQTGLNPNPVDVQQVIKNDQAVFVFRLGGADHIDSPVIVRAPGGDLKLDITDNDPSHTVTILKGGGETETMQTGQFARMVIDKNTLDKIPDGNIATEVNAGLGYRNLFKIGEGDGHNGFIHAGRYVEQDGKFVVQSFATIQGTGGVSIGGGGGEPIVDPGKPIPEPGVETPTFVLTPPGYDWSKMRDLFLVPWPVAIPIERSYKEGSQFAPPTQTPPTQTTPPITPPSQTPTWPTPGPVRPRTPEEQQKLEEMQSELTKLKAKQSKTAEEEKRQKELEKELQELQSSTKAPEATTKQEGLSMKAIKELSKWFDGINGAINTGHRYYVTNVPDSINISADQLKQLQLPVQFFVERSDGQVGPNIEVTPFLYELTTEPGVGTNQVVLQLLQQRGLSRSEAPRFYNAEQSKTYGDSGIHALAAASASTPEEQAKLYNALARVILKVHESNPQLVNEWWKKQVDENSGASSRFFLAFDHIIVNRTVGDLRPENERLVVGQNNQPLNESEMRDLWQKRIKELQTALASGKLELYHIRQIEFLAHSVNVVKTIEMMKSAPTPPAQPPQTEEADSTAQTQTDEAQRAELNRKIQIKQFTDRLAAGLNVPGANEARKKELINEYLLGIIDEHNIDKTLPLDRMLTVTTGTYNHLTQKLGVDGLNKLIADTSPVNSIFAPAVMPTLNEAVTKQVYRDASMRVIDKVFSENKELRSLFEAETAEGKKGVILLILGTVNVTLNATKV